MQFDEYVVHAVPGMLRLARVLSGNRPDAEDLVQDVLVKLLAAWERLDHVSDRDAYVRRMIVNEYLTGQRKRVRSAELHRYWSPPDDGEVGDAVSIQMVVRDRLAALPDRQRAVVVLRYFLGMSDEDIAIDLGCTRGTVRSHASLALATLRIQLVETATTRAEDAS